MQRFEYAGVGLAAVLACHLGQRVIRVSADNDTRRLMDMPVTATEVEEIDLRVFGTQIHGAVDCSLMELNGTITIRLISGSY